MFQFQPGRMYQMPVHFGPCCGPRQNPVGERFYQDGPQTSILHTLVYETRAECLDPFLPEGFSVRRPYIIVTHKMHRALPWLAGRGYNVVTCNVPVTYQGTSETILGQYQLAIWENHADPILCGREQLGYAKLYAEIDDMRTYLGVSSAALSSWGFRFLELHFNLFSAPEDPDQLQAILDEPESEGLLHYKYIPHTGDGFCTADVAYVTLTPKQYPLPEDAPPLPSPEYVCGTGSLSWHVPQWEDMPTQYHIVQALSSLPIVRILGARAATTQHYNDVFYQRIVR